MIDNEELSIDLLLCDNRSLIKQLEIANNQIKFLERDKKELSELISGKTIDSSTEEFLNKKIKELVLRNDKLEYIIKINRDGNKNILFIKKKTMDEILLILDSFYIMGSYSNGNKLERIRNELREILNRYSSFALGVDYGN